MDISVPSRFACLKIEDDDFRPPNRITTTNGEPKKREKLNIKKQQTVTTKQDNNNSKKNRQPTEKKGKKKNVPDKQWEEWKERDSEIVDGNFEEDLKNAIFLSKLDYEERKLENNQTVKNSDDKKKNVQIKKKKNKAMSLDQFLNKNENNNTTPVVKPNVVVDDYKFFERVQMEIKEEVIKEKISEKRKEREANIEEIITIAQFQEKLKVERNKNKKLEQELENVKKDMAVVKERNKKLCGILGYGEMKDKADIIIELQHLNKVKDELTDEVKRLHVLLEQERSKVPSSNLDTHTNKHSKDKKHKKHSS